MSGHDVLVGAVLVVGAFKLYGSTHPALVNLDGLGYLKQLSHNFAAGHLLYLPLLRAVAVLFGGRTLEAALWLSAVAGAASVGLFFACARSLLPRWPAFFASCGLAVCYAAWVQGSDVEVYACALSALLGVFAVAIAYRAMPSMTAAVALGLALGIAVLFHLTHVVATPFVIAWIVSSVHDPSIPPGSPRPHRTRRALLHSAVASVVGGVVALAGYAWAALHVRHLDLWGAIGWVGTAGHGFQYQGSVLSRFADSVYGLSRALVWSPYLYESNAQTLLGQFLLGLAALSFLVGVAIAKRRALWPLPVAALCTWVAGYALMAFAFFGSDHERWLFVLPPLWLLAAGAIRALRFGPLWLAGVGLSLAIVNHQSAIGPSSHDTWDRTRADAASEILRDGDLVLFPGHGWDEYVGFYTGRRIEPMPLAYYAGLLGKAGATARVAVEVKAARARGRDVYAVRLLDDADTDRRGFYELETLGFSRADLHALIGQFRIVKLATSQPEVSVWRLDEPTAPPR